MQLPGPQLAFSQGTHTEWGKPAVWALPIPCTSAQVCSILKGDFLKRLQSQQEGCGWEKAEELSEPQSFPVTSNNASQQ